MKGIFKYWSLKIVSFGEYRRCSSYYALGDDEAQGTHSNAVLIARIVFVALETITLFCIHPLMSRNPHFHFSNPPGDETISDEAWSTIAIQSKTEERATAIKSATLYVQICCSRLHHEFSWVFRLFDLRYCTTSTHYFPILASPRASTEI